MKTYRTSMTLPDGTRKFYRGKTQEEAEAKKAKDLELLDQGINISEDPTMTDLAELWYDTFINDADHHIRSKQTTRGILDRYVIPYFKKQKVRDVKPLDIRRMLKTYDKYSHSTQKKILNATRSMLDLAVENEVILRNPALKTITAGGETPEEVEPLTDAQLEALLSAVHGTRAYLFVLTLALAGLRKGEALGLMWKDIDFEHGTLHAQRSVVYPTDNRKGIINPDMKTDNANRIIPLDPALLSAFKEAKRHTNSVYVFSMSNGSFLSESSFRKMWQLIDYRTKGTEGKTAFVERTLDFKVHPHQLRHTCITNWIRNGLGVKEAQYLAGHSTPEITMSIYAHYQAELEREGTAQKVAQSRSTLSIPSVATL